MWIVYEKKTVQKVLRKLPKEVSIKYEAWKRIVELQGVSGLRRVRGFGDEALKGSWKGFRSSRLGIKWRVIYTVVDEELEVFVVEITPHNY